MNILLKKLGSKNLNNTLGLFLFLVLFSTSLFATTYSPRIQLTFMDTNMAINKYYEKHGQYPNQKDGLFELIKEGYMTKYPLDPWGFPIIYESNPDASKYSIKSFGETNGYKYSKDVPEYAIASQTLPNIPIYVIGFFFLLIVLLYKIILHFVKRK